MLAALNHPNIAQIYGWAAEGKSVYFGRYEGAVRPAPTRMLLGVGGWRQRVLRDNPPRPVQTMRCSPDGKYLPATPSRLKNGAHPAFTEIWIPTQEHRGDFSQTLILTWHAGVKR